MPVGFTDKEKQRASLLFGRKQSTARDKKDAKDHKHSSHEEKDKERKHGHARTGASIFVSHGDTQHKAELAEAVDHLEHLVDHMLAHNEEHKPHTEASSAEHAAFHHTQAELHTMHNELEHFRDHHGIPDHEHRLAHLTSHNEHNESHGEQHLREMISELAERLTHLSTFNAEAVMMMFEIVFDRVKEGMNLVRAGEHAHGHGTHRHTETHGEHDHSLENHKHTIEELQERLLHNKFHNRPKHELHDEVRELLEHLEHILMVEEHHEKPSPKPSRRPAFADSV